MRVHNVQVQEVDLNTCQADGVRETVQMIPGKLLHAVCHFLCLPSEGKVSNVENHLNSILKFVLLLMCNESWTSLAGQFYSAYILLHVRVHMCLSLCVLRPGRALYS